MMRFGHVFACPACGENLFVPSTYRKRVRWATLTILTVSAYVLGARDVSWLIIVILGYLPSFFVVGNIMKRKFPPPLLVGDECG